MLLLAILLFGSDTYGATACRPLTELHARIRYCFDNPGYVPPATECRDRFRTVLNEKYPEIQRLLNSTANAGHDSAQNLKFDTTKSVYDHTDAELTNLINLGTQTLSEIEAYADDFVPPIPSWAPGHWKPDRKDPHERARDIDYYCWAEPMGNMDPLIADLQKMLSELTTTREKTRQLHGFSANRDVNLSILAQDDSGLSAKHRGFSGKGAENGASTVTGEIRNATLESKATVNASISSGSAGKSNWTESFNSALKGRDGALSGTELRVGPAISPESVKLDAKEKSSSPLAAIAEGALDQLSSTENPALAGAAGRAGEAAGGTRAPASLSGSSANDDSGKTSLAMAASLGHEGTAAMRASGAVNADLRDLFQRTHAAYERTQIRKQL